MIQFDFIPKDLTINSWADLKPYFEKLETLQINSEKDLESLILNYSQVLSVFYEQNARAYIQMTCHTDNADYVARHELFSTIIAPEIEVACNTIQKKIAENSFAEKLNQDRYGLLLQNTRHEILMFREENVPIEAELAKLSSDYGQLAGSFTAHVNGEDMPLPKANALLQSADRSLRESAWTAIVSTYQTNKDKLDTLFNQMIEKRQLIATNTGFKNFRDYAHENMQRFDYTVDQVLEFHDAIEKHVIPLKNKFTLAHAKELNLESDYRPWDGNAPKPSELELKPFSSAQELLDKTKKIFSLLKPEFAANLKKMEEAQLFDLESRKAKAPGGYNYGLEVTGMPFIFMNAAGIHRDVTTLMHEGGHAMHTFLTANEPLIEYRHTPSEMAETASMSMELMTSPFWGEFYPDEKVLKQARREHLEDVIDTFPWVATVDAFQHWIYTHPNHSVAERDTAFENLMLRFGSSVVNWQGLEKYRKNLWQKQLHIFEVPFYYIEYAIAQIGALQMYRQFTINRDEAINNYCKGLALGSTKTLPEVWNAMGIKFDFSSKMIGELMRFVEDELAKLQ